MAATTLLELATAQRDAAEAEHASLQQALLDAQTSRADARADLDQTTSDLAALNKDISATRAALAAIETPADGEPLLAQLETQITDQRAKQAELIEREEALSEAEHAEQTASAAVATADARLRAAQDHLDRETEDSDARDELKTAAQAAPLSSVPAGADAAINTAPDNADFTAAKARIEADIPAALITRARERRAAATADLDRVETALETAQNLGDGKAADDFQRAEAALREFVALAQSRFDQAKSLLAGVADTTNKPLTSEQVSQITDTDMVNDGTAAAAAEQARDDAQTTVEVEQDKVDDAILATLITDIDATPAPDTTDLDNAQPVLTAAEAAYTPALKDDLNAWEAAVPDDTWQLLEDFEHAQATLTELGNADPTALAAALDSTELALVTELEAADKADRTTRFLDGEIVTRAADLERRRNLARRVRFGALRGDG